jgi:hypothetical protein
MHTRLALPAAALLAAALAPSGCRSPDAEPAGPAPWQTYAPAAAPVAPRMPAHQQPRVMLMIDEQSLGTIPTAEVQALASAMLLECNVRVVDQEMLGANLAKGQKLLKDAGDNRGAAALGQQFGADLVVVGEAVAKPSARRIADTELRSYQAAVTLRAIRTDSAATIASASEDATVVGLEDVAGSAKALKAAGRKTLELLLPAMLSAWAREPAGAAGGRGTVRMVLTVGGVDQMWKLKAVRDRLRGMAEEIANVTQRSYVAGSAEFDVSALKPAEEVAEALVLKPPDGLKLQVLEIAAGRITMRATAP